MCVRMYIHVDTSIRINTIHMYTKVSMNKCIHMHLRTCVHLQPCTRICTIYIYTELLIYMYMNIHAFAFMCQVQYTYIYIHICGYACTYVCKVHVHTCVTCTYIRV